MTRINAGIDVKRLTDEHLLAEHREIKRLPWCLDAAIKSGSINHIPEKFTLGKGHVLFFLDKMAYTWFRYFEIYAELKKRGFAIKDYSSNWTNIDPITYMKYGKHYKPTNEDVALLVERISERIRESKKEVWHYYGEAISKERAIELLTKTIYS